MEIQPLRLIQAAKPSAQLNLLENLQIGQQLYAKVVEQLPEKNQVLIQIGQRIARATSDIPVTPQQTLKLQVQQLKDQITLRILDPAPKGAELTQAALRRLLPIQQPVAQLLPRLQSVTHQIPTPPNQTGQLLQQIQNLSERLIQTVPESRQLFSADGVKSALRSSGLFLESAIQKQTLQSTPIQVRATGTTPILKSETPVPQDARSQIVRADRPTTPQPLPGLQQTTTAGSNQPTINQTSSPITEAPSLKNQPPGTSQSTLPQPNLNQAPLSQVDVKANLLRLITLIRNWPGIQPSSQPLKTTETPANQPGANPPTSSAPRTAPPSQTPQTTVVIQQLRELLNASESSVAKIAVHQLNTANASEEMARPQWQTEIPVIHGNQTGSILMRIEEEGSSQSKRPEDMPWRVTLELNPPKLGTIRCQIQLKQQQISTDFRAENPETAHLIRQNLDAFKERLNAAHFETQSIRCEQGHGDEMNPSPMTTSILNEKA